MAGRGLATAGAGEEGTGCHGGLLEPPRSRTASRGQWGVTGQLQTDSGPVSWVSHSGGSVEGGPHTEGPGSAQMRPELRQDCDAGKGWLSGLVETGALRGTDDFLFRSVGRKDNCPSPLIKSHSFDSIALPLILVTNRPAKRVQPWVPRPGKQLGETGPGKPQGSQEDCLLLGQ